MRVRIRASLCSTVSEAGALIFFRHPDLLENAMTRRPPLASVAPEIAAPAESSDSQPDSESFLTSLVNDNDSLCLAQSSTEPVEAVGVCCEKIDMFLWYADPVWTTLTTLTLTRRLTTLRPAVCAKARGAERKSPENTSRRAWTLSSFVLDSVPRRRASWRSKFGCSYIFVTDFWPVVLPLEFTPERTAGTEHAPRLPIPAGTDVATPSESFDSNLPNYW